MKKILRFFLPVILFPVSLSAQTLAPGDIAVLGFNADQSTDLDADGFQDAKWAVVALTAIPSGTVVRFTDAGIKEDGSFYVNTNNEGHLSWTVTTPVPAGHVFAMDCVDGSNFADLNGATAGNGGLTDYGTVSGHLGGTSIGLGVPFGTSGDQVIIYQGTLGSTVGANFIYGLNTQQNSLLSGLGVWQNSGTVTAATQSFIPSGLTNGTTALALTTNVANTSSGPGTVGTANYGFDNMAYQGITTGSKAALLAAIGNPANWAGDNTNPYNFGIGAGFTYSANFTVSGLPLFWGAFTGTVSGGNGILSWTTLQESNLGHFDIEGSADGLHFSTIGSQPAAGYSATARNYQYSVDAKSNRYYRIRAVDQDGAFSLSGTIVLKTISSGGIALLGNPVQGDRLQWTAPGATQFTITDAAGKRLLSGRGTGTLQSVNLAGLPKGNYRLVISTDAGTISLPFIK